MDALGRLFNIVPTASGVQVNLEDARACAFVLVGADTYTIQEAQDAAGTGAQNLAVVDHYHEATAADGSVAWTRTEEDPAVAAVTLATGEVAVVEVQAASLSDGFGYVSCAGAGTGLVYAIPHDLHVQRAPELLPAAAA